MRLKILLIGKNGQVGWELQRALADLGEVIATGRCSLDLTDAAQIRGVIKSAKPNIIVNAAAYTAVDRAESEPQLAMAINATAPGIMAQAAKKVNALLVHYSTDYVFDGMKKGAYVESDPTNPLNIYGRSKLAGEEAIRSSGADHLIFRTSWIYSNRGSNFLLTVKRMLRDKREMRIINDQIGAPTWARDIAEGTANALKILLDQNEQQRRELFGTYHMTAAGETSWYGFVREIATAEGAKAGGTLPKVTAIPSREYQTAAQRPLNSVLANKKLDQAFGFRLPEWKRSLQEALLEK